MKWKHLDEHLLKHHLNEALNKCLELEKIKVKGEDLAHSFPLDHDYYQLLEKFEDHLKLIIKINKEG